MSDKYKPYEHPRWKDTPMPKRKGVTVGKVDPEKQKKFEDMKKKAIDNFKRK